jgi:trk system potassium uptake protein TrkA
MSPEHGRILDADRGAPHDPPESETGRRVAHLVGGRLLDYIEFDDGFAIVKMSPPQETIGFTLAQSDIPRKYGVTVVGVKSRRVEDFTCRPALDTKVVGARHPHRQWPHGR